MTKIAVMYGVEHLQLVNIYIASIPIDVQAKPFERAGIGYYYSVDPRQERIHIECAQCAETKNCDYWIWMNCSNYM